MDPPLPEALTRLLSAVRAAGGRGILVGGYVRDRLLGLDPKDFDVEVYGVEQGALESVLSEFGEVMTVGRSFGVYKVRGWGIEVDISLPRRDSKIGAGHKGFQVRTDSGLTFEEAARRRDFTLNSIGWDPLADECLDPFGGREDLDRRILRVTDSETFAEDPLRVYRAMQFLARFDLEATGELREICRSVGRAGSLRELPGERVLDEFVKLLLKSRKPSIGLAFLRDTGLLSEFPELGAMVGCPQDPEWHPEGDVWTHTLMVVDVAAEFRTGEREDDLILMFGALCHDLGKPMTTSLVEGRWRSPEHEAAGEEPTRRFLGRLKGLPDRVVEAVVLMVRYHLTPHHWMAGKAGPAAYRRMARRLAAAGTNLEMLERVARTDHFGRTTRAAIAREFPAGDQLRERMRSLHIQKEAPRDVVMGRHLIARGMTPGPGFGPILARCRRIQDETGSIDPEEILARVFSPEEEAGHRDDSGV